MRWITVVALCLTVATARAEDWGVKRDPFDATVVRRYKAILAKDPHDAGALNTLLGLYKRYRKVETLDAEYRAELAKNESWATLVVLARMPRSRQEAVALWHKALALKPDDARGWVASGDLAIGAADAKTARDAYRKAATLSTANPKLKKVVLGKLIGAARSANDWPSIDAAYVELIALSPKDGMLWLERGNAQLAASKHAEARDSFITAEALLKTDPERRLLAGVNQGIALERMGRVDEAMAQYEATLDKVPKGFYLAVEILPRIVDLERKRGRLLDAIARLEKRWPEKQRGHFEWDYLGDLYKEAKDDARALDAYKKAVAKAPTEVVSQRKLIALLEKLEPDQALAQHEKAARLAPGDAELQIALAKRYQPTVPAKAVATLERLAKRFPTNINVRRTIAGLYEAWNETKKAIAEYEAIANIEPKEPDHAIVLGEVLWRAGEQDRAKDAWKRLETIGTADSHFKHAESLAIHEVWPDAEAAYTKALALDGRNADAWYGRARANDALTQYDKAVVDAQRAVSLTGTSSHNDGERYRVLLVRILGHWYAAGDKKALVATLAKWRFAFDHGDPVAGYLLAAHHARIGSLQQHDVLVALYKQVPTDDTLGMAVARSHVRRKEFAQAKAAYERIAARDPKRAKDVAKLVAQVDEDALRWEVDSRGEEEGLSPSARRKADGTDLVGRHRRLGYRMAVGSDVSGTGSALLGVGLYRQHRVVRGTTIGVRAEWLQRDDPMEEVNTIAVGATIATRLWDAQKFEIALGLGPRFEVRYGSEADDSTWDRGAITGDATLELLPRALPATIGLRYNHTLTDTVRASSLVFELGFELR